MYITYMYVCIHTHTHIHTHTYIHTHKHTHIHTHTYTHTYIYMHIYMFYSSILLNICLQSSATLSLSFLLYIFVIYMSAEFSYFILELLVVLVVAAYYNICFAHLCLYIYMLSSSLYTVRCL